jgi:uncharacterized protein YjbJ (UPF0337 family)
MSINDKIKASAKDTEGKMQSAAGELTDNQKMKAEGELKQVQADGMKTAAEVKEAAAKTADKIKDATN